MATYVPAKVSTQFVFYASLVSQANPKLMQVNPTLAAGDFKVSIDGGALANLATLPTVTPAGGSMVKFTLSTSEMAGANATVVCLDAAGSEWCDLTINIPTAARQVDDLAYPATSGRSMVVDASGLVDANTVKVGPSGSGTAQTAGDLKAVLGSPAGASLSVDVAAVKTDTAAVKVQTDKLTFTVANQLDSNVLDWKSATAPAMTGDAFARLGAPAGASVSADVAAVKTDTAAVKVQTDKLAFTVANQIDANVIDWKGATAPAMTGDAFARLGAPAGASVSADVASIKTDTGTTIPGRLPAALVSGRIDASVGAVAANAITAAAIADAAIDRATFAVDTGLQTVRSNTAQAGGASTITLDAAASATDSIYNGQLVLLTGATGAGQSRVIVGYVGATKVATVDRAWQTNPDATTTFAIEGTDSAKTNSALEVVAASVTGAVASVTGAVASVTGNVGGNVVGSVASVTAGVTVGAGGIQSTSFAAGAIDAAAIATDAIGSAEIATTAIDEIWNSAIGDSTITARQAMKAFMAALAGKASGAATTTMTFRNINDDTDVIVATVDANGNRTAITLTL